MQPNFIQVCDRCQVLPVYVILWYKELNAGVKVSSDQIISVLDIACTNKHSQWRIEHAVSDASLNKQ